MFLILQLPSLQQVSGPLDVLRGLDKLKTLLVSKTKVTGTITNELCSQWPKLESVDVSYTSVEYKVMSPTAQGFAANHTRYVPAFASKLKFLDISNLETPMDMSVGEFFEGLMWSTDLDTLIANSVTQNKQP